MNHFKLVVLFYLCAILFSCAAGWYFKNKGRVDVAIVFDYCKSGDMPTVHNRILKPGESFDYDLKNPWIGKFHCYIYVLAFSSRTPRWTNLLTTIIVNGKTYATFLEHCQQPCRVEFVEDLNFVIL